MATCPILGCPLGVKPVVCPRCSFAACQSCARAWVMEKDEPRCLSCDQAWTLDFLSDAFPKSFLNGPYRDRERINVVEREKAMLGDAQGTKEFALARWILRESKEFTVPELPMDEVNTFCLPSLLFVPHQQVAWNPIFLAVKRAQTRVPLDKIELARRVVPWYEANKARIEAKMVEWNALVATEARPVEDRVVGRPCPIGDCRGMVVHGVCQVCEETVCGDCWEHIKKTARGTLEEHTCNPSTVESVNDIKKNTRQCPRCRQPIFRNGGCSQMWCTACKTAFSWLTGKVLDTRRGYSNPHFHQERPSVRAGASEEAPRCDTQLKDGLRSVLHLMSFDANPALFSVYNYHSHVETVLGDLANLLQRTNIDLRVQYALGLIDEDTFSSAVFLRHRVLQLTEVEVGILETFRDRATALLNTLELFYPKWSTPRRPIYTLVAESVNKVNAQCEALLAETNAALAREAAKVQLTGRKIRWDGKKYGGHYIDTSRTWVVTGICGPVNAYFAHLQ